MMNLRKLFSPPLFQGNLNKLNYFEGWYFKQVSATFDEVISVIPGVSLAGQRHAFIQVINGISGETHYIDYPSSAFTASDKKFDIKIGQSRFCTEGIDLDIQAPGLRLEGALKYHQITPWPKNILSPGIMGWYSFVPMMECYHGVVSMDHRTEGSLNLNGKLLDFNQGRGYIEKDWGTSMPESWIWLHANTFNMPGTSVMLSIAKIPWRKSYFTGFICFVLHQQKLYRFMTYNGTKIVQAHLKDQHFSVVLENRHHRLTINAEQKKAGKLKAPVKGLMERYIKESIDSAVSIELQKRNNQVIFKGLAQRAGLELVGKPSLLLP